jgi:L-malate glycosyltransferase
MRILYLIDEMQAVSAGGTERQVLQLARLLKEAGAEVNIGTFRGTHWLTSEIAGCHVEHFNFRSVWRFSSLMELHRVVTWMREHNIQVLQTFFVEANILGPLLGWWAGVPVILGSRRNLNYWMNPGTALLQRIANWFCTRLVANGKAVQEHVSRTEHVSLERIEVIHNGLDTDQFYSDGKLRSLSRATFGYLESDIIIGAVSGLRPVKGCETFIDAAAEVLRHAPDVRFVLVGDGPLRSSLEAQAAPLGDHFRFVGAQEDIRPFLSMFDIAVLASESEGFSNSILEYMAAGLPSVVTDVGGNPEAIENAGIIVKPKQPLDLANALLSLIKDPTRRKALAQQARARAQSFSLPSTRATWVRFYERTLGQRKAQAKA